MNSTLLNPKHMVKGLQYLKKEVDVTNKYVGLYENVLEHVRKEEEKKVGCNKRWMKGYKEQFRKKYEEIWSKLMSYIHIYLSLIHI